MKKIVIKNYDLSPLDGTEVFIEGDRIKIEIFQNQIKLLLYAYGEFVEGVVTIEPTNTPKKYLKLVRNLLIGLGIEIIEE